jgi:hypothetical protein
MRTNTRLVVLTLAVISLLAGPAAGRAYAVSARDLVELSKEGVSDAVLIALIETDGSRFVLSVSDIRDLRTRGLSDEVIVAMIRTRPLSGPPRDGVADALPPAEPAPAPRTIVIHEPAPPPVVVTQTVTQRVEVERRDDPPAAVYVPVYVPVPARPVEVKKAEPEYWGWGGKRRPDAWKEPVIIK